MFNTSVTNSGLSIKNMIQIRMDGANVNWKFYEKMGDEWSVSFLLSSLYYHFKDSTAQREDFVKVTFVIHRWLENVAVSERALNICNNIEVYVKVVKEKRIPNPGNKSFEVIKEAVNNKLVLTKLHYCKYIAS